MAKLGHFFETHVEKIVLGVAGLLGLWLIFIRVLFSPNTVELNNETFSPKTIDTQIARRFADPLRERLNGPPEGGSVLRGPYDSPLDANDPIRAGIHGDWPRGFLELFEHPLQYVNADLYPPSPRYSAGEKQEKREYALPVIDDVTDVSVGHIRAAAYFPLDAVSEENPYESANHEPNDLDLVTVQARFNVSLLRSRFYASFAGEDLPKRWRDKTLAEPVFAEVQLERQTLGDGGDWGPWVEVPRLAIEHRDALLHPIHRAEDLPPGGIRVKALELNDEEIRMALLQPVAYDIASAHEDWFPPSLHGEFLDMREKEIAYEKREEREAERDSRANDRNNSRENRRGRGGQMAGGRGGATDSQGGLYGGAETGRRTRGGGNTRGNARQDPLGGRQRGARDNRGGRGAGRDAELLYEMGGATPTRAARNQPSVDDVYQELTDLMLKRGEDFAKVEELTFWAHDDRVEPGQTYRYRLRLGVLNPVAGTGNVRAADMARANDVILWSPFTDATEAVYVPQRLRFFAREYKSATDQVKVEVAKFEMGYWNTETFTVKPGEMIGKVVELEKKDEGRGLGVPGGAARGLQAGLPYYDTPFGLNQQPETVDYSTGAVLVGAVRVDGWTPGTRLRSQVSHDMLYTRDGVDIERAPIASNNWTSDIASSYSRIKSLEDEPREPFRDFGGSPAKRGALGRGGRGGRGGDYDMMLYEY